LKASPLAALLALAVPAPAQTPIGPFAGQHQEDFEGPIVIFETCLPSGVFNGTAQLCALDPNDLLTSTGWLFQCNLPAYQNSWLCGSAGGPVELTFPQAAVRFGGWFATNSGAPDARFDFYDAGNALLGSHVAAIPASCTWSWHGWSFPAGASRIRITGLSGWGGGFVQMDALEVEYGAGAPTPIVYCTAATTSHGCVASISASANPDVGHASPCNVSVAGVEGQKQGIVFYGLSQSASPWCLGSFLCVKAPTQRTGVQGSGGTAGQCDGSLALDWNAYQLANPGSVGWPFTAGESAFVQAWFRDPPACKTTSLSDAVRLTYVP
jgi:hypothetical protein